MDQLHAQNRDTLDIYKRIKKSAYKHKLTALFYDAIFVSPVPKQNINNNLSDEQKIHDPNAQFAGKIIKSIIITIDDPFGHSVNDTFTRATNNIQDFGNKLHISTHKRIIRNILLFKPNDRLEQLRITESERLIRTMSYVNDARIFIKESSQADSVDIEVRIMDKWSLVGWGGANFNSGYFAIRDKNIGGFGQTYEQYIGYDKLGQYDYRGNYHISNIKNSFISSNIFYTTTPIETTSGIDLNRPFFSPLAKWAGGAAGKNTWKKYSYFDSIENHLALNYYNYDLWLAKSFNMHKIKKTENHPQIILGLRYNGTYYWDRPPFSIDTMYLNSKNDMVLLNFSYSIRKYYKDMFIYRFGANEDVPEGLLVQTTYGFIQKEFTQLQYYSGLEISNGNYLKKFGYLSGYISYGAYFGEKSKNNSSINAGISYFSNLYKSRKWYFRHFFYYKFIEGFNKDENTKITLQTNEMYGFNAGNLSGNGKMLLNLEAIAYAPYNLIGFQFAPVLSFGYGLIQSTTTPFKNSQIYQAYSMGILIRNENLLNASFQFSIGYYPEQPGSTDNTYKFNPIGSFSLKLKSFDHLKPEIVEYY